VQEVGVRLLRGLSPVRTEQFVYDESWGGGGRARESERKRKCVRVHVLQKSRSLKVLFFDKNLNN